jgi:hypothetical protein
MADNERSYLEMSDEEMMNAPLPTEPTKEAEPTEEPEVEESATNEKPDIEDTKEEEESNVLNSADDEVDNEEEQEQDTDDETDADEASEEEATAESKDAKEAEVEEDTEEKEVKTKEDSSEEAEIDYKAEYERVLAPFKANGREIQPKSVDDAISLMQMGANYNKKMSAIKPNLKIMKLLENNDLLDEKKLNFLIDLDKKTPEAIHKLIKDSGIDPMDIDTEKESEYVPKSRSVDDRELLLDSVLEDIAGTDSYNRTLDIVTKEWDGASKQVVANAPEILRVINDHVASGIYDIIQSEVESERVFGRLNGKSDIEAYKIVGDAIDAKGGFKHLIKTNVNPTSKKPVIVQPKSKVVSDKLNEKRRAASNTKPTSPATAKQEFNPLAMSDEEFNNMSASR